MKKKTMLAEIVVKSDHPDALPDWGLGKGVLYKAELSFKDVANRGFDHPMFALSLADEEDKMIHAHVEVRWTEVKKKK